MKKFLLILLSAIVLSISANAVSLYIDTQKLETDTPPVVIDGRTLVPVRAIFESLGAEVSWNQDTQTAIGTRDGTRIVIKINDTIAYVDGVPYTLDVPAQLVNNRTMVPARFISESLNCDVTWDQDTKTASVANAMKGQKIYATDTGNKFHYNSNCNGGTYYEVTLAEALGRGLSACEKCIGAEAEEPNNVSGTGQIVDVSQYFYFDNNKHQNH